MLHSGMPKWKVFYGETFYQSATVTATGNTGVIATTFATHGASAVFPLSFVATGTSMLSDETNTLTIDWYPDAAGTVIPTLVTTTTFTQLTTSVLVVAEGWPVDVTVMNAGRDLYPLFPYMKITHTLGGTSKSMAYSIAINFMRFEA